MQWQTPSRFNGIPTHWRDHPVFHPKQVVGRFEFHQEENEKVGEYTNQLRLICFYFKPIAQCQYWLLTKFIISLFYAFQIWSIVLYKLGRTTGSGVIGPRLQLPYIPTRREVGGDLVLGLLRKACGSGCFTVYRCVWLCSQVSQELGVGSFWYGGPEGQTSFQG